MKMNIDKICILLIISIVAFSGIVFSETSSASAKPETWVQENPLATSYEFSHLTATITVTVKNTNDHVQYFKISQAYKGSLNDTIQWKISWTDPTAVKMVKSRYPELGGDYGWPIQAGETKTVSFKLYAVGPMGDVPSYIVRQGEDNNTYWPLINEPGLDGSVFSPNELEILNPTLDLKKWKGHFTFRLTNIDNKKVYGIVRAPIAPTGSTLTSSSPKAFIDNDNFPSTNMAAWNVIMEPDTYKDFGYTYSWPLSSSSSVAKASSATITGSSGSSGSSSVPSKTTGVPYGLFVVGALVAAAGVGYARLMR